MDRLVAADPVHEEARRVPRLGGLLGDRFLGKLVVEVGELDGGFARERSRETPGAATP